MFMNWWIDNENVVPVYNGILLFVKKKNEPIKFWSKYLELKNRLQIEITQAQKDNTYFQSYVNHSTESLDTCI